MIKQTRFRYRRAPAQFALAACIGFYAAGMSTAFAQTTSSTEDGGQWRLGVSAALIDKAYRDFDRETLALPVIAYENKWVSASLPTLDVKAYTGESISVRLRARWSADGYEAKDAPILRGMEERKGSMWVGGAVIWKAGFANLSAEALTDAMDKSQGTRAKLQIDRRFSAGRIGFTPRLGAEWVDKKYVDYYYGVRQSEVMQGRAAYLGKATTNVQAGLRVDYSPGAHHTVFLDLNMTRFGAAIEDSPLVDKPNQTSVGLGYVYRF